MLEKIHKEVQLREIWPNITTQARRSFLIKTRDILARNQKQKNSHKSLFKLTKSSATGNSNQREMQRKT